MATLVIFKAFHSYTAVMEFLDAVKAEYESQLVQYTDEVYYRELFNDYKVIINIYAPR